ncbi:MAG TPA: plastocyanin/azurin family copper-binding protein [Solirubrobacterales bacterium]|jgi:plastocyanin
MPYSTVFYILGGCLAGLAVITAFLGLRSEKFPGRFAPLVALGFIALIGATTTYAVLNGQDEQEARATELEKAGEEVEAEEENPTPVEEEGAEEEGAEAGQPEGGAKPAPAPAKAKGPGGTLQLAASPTEIAFNKKALHSRPGKVTIDFTNPSALEHDVAIEQNGKQIAVSPRITNGKTSISAELAPGEYTFLCTVPGHAEAGMQGTLTVE